MLVKESIILKFRLDEETILETIMQYLGASPSGYVFMQTSQSDPVFITISPAILNMIIHYENNFFVSKYH